LSQRTDDLTASLEQQTATSQVLQVISSSPGDLEPVFNAMLENATRICGAQFGNLILCEGGVFRYVALYGAPAAFAEQRRREPVIRPRPGALLDRVIQTKKAAHVADIAAENANDSQEIVELAGARSVVVVPMLKEHELIGVIGIYRQEVQPFTDKQIGLVQNFAAQAVIAIENTRLLNELRQRTDDLSEALEQQTATSEVLKVISSSPGDLGPVFEAILANATRICDGKFGNLWLHEGEDFRAASIYGAPPEYRALVMNGLKARPGAGTPLAGVIETRTPVQMADMAASRAYLVLWWSPASKSPAPGRWYAYRCSRMTS